MKKAIKILSLLLVICIMFVVAGCDDNGPTTSTIREEYWEEVSGTDGSGDNSTDNSSTFVPIEGDGEGDSVFATTGTARQKWVNLFGEKYVKDRETYEKTHKPYNVPANLKGTTVKFVTWIDHRTTESKFAVQNFEKATGIKFEWVQVPQSTYVSKITSSVAAGVNIGDVILENNDSFAQLLSVSQPLNKIKSIDMNDPIWDKGFFNYSTFNGNVYHCNAINSPWQNGNMLYYNEKALKDNGITTPGEYLEVGKWSWDNAIKIMREFKALNSSYTGANLQSVRIMLLANGTEFMYMKNGKMVSGVNESAFKSTVEAFYDLQDAGLLGGSSTTLIKGTTAMLLSDTNGLKKSGTFKGQNASHIKAVPVPAISGSGKISTHYRAYAVCKGAKNPEGAGYFLRYFLDPYNYNWDDIFLNEDAKKVFVKYCGGADFSTKAVGWSLSGTKGILGATDWEGIYAWDNTINRGSSSQVNTTLSTLSSQVDDCVKKTNQILSELK